MAYRTNWLSFDIYVSTMWASLNVALYSDTTIGTTCSHVTDLVAAFWTFYNSHDDLLLFNEYLYVLLIILPIIGLFLCTAVNDA